MPNDYANAPYSLAQQAKKEANIISPKGEDVATLRHRLKKIPELSGGAKWVDPKAIIHRDPSNSIDRMRFEPQDVEQPDEVVQKT
jgi:hypothetical protein